ncbi:hypothetical protein AVEN_216624-1 [Araneus ventricosus]|uniref:Uncharacterized protein n=1 Tax=Araneus ventricosus TaxID=182803 RepID=A0A4Y2DX61_ARAVE|nr:hypothetical protein AVEN_216624-1 [Araneus ventricosus]
MDTSETLINENGATNDKQNVAADNFISSNELHGPEPFPNYEESSHCCKSLTVGRSAHQLPRSHCGRSSQVVPNGSNPNSSDPGAVLKYALRQAVTSHGVFSCIPFPNRNIEKWVVFSGIIYLSPRSGIPDQPLPVNPCLTLIKLNSHGDHTYPKKGVKRKRPPGRKENPLKHAGEQRAPAPWIRPIETLKNSVQTMPTVAGAS